MLRKAGVLTALLATTIALAACGGSSPSNRLSASTAARQSDGLKLAQCMRKHGVADFPDPSSGGGFGIQASSGGGNATFSVDGHSINVSGTTFQRAMRRCRSAMPQGPPISGSQLARIKRGALRMAACMRSHGVPSFPDPQVSTGPNGKGIAVRIGAPPGANQAVHLNPNSPAFQRAQKTCMPLMGALGPKGQKVGK